MPRSAALRLRRSLGGLPVLLGLAAYVAAVHAVLVLGGSLLLGRSGSPSPLLAILATGVVALTVEPAQSWLRRRGAAGRGEQPPSPYEVLRTFSRSVAGSCPPEHLPAEMAGVVARATGARSVEVWLQLRDRLVLAARESSGTGGTEPGAQRESDGRPARPGEASGGHVRSYDVRSDGEVLAVLRLRLDGPALAPAEERLLAGLAAQAGLALRGARLRAELAERARELAVQADELRASRQRLVAAQDDERRHLERDIHDGAQQHLVALAVNLRLAQALAGRSPQRAGDLLRAQAGAARQAVDTVVDLSRGIYPPVLRECGVLAAVEAAAASSSIPVHVEAQGVGRYPLEVEAAVYFACLEALQNAGKHSGARAVEVHLRDEGGQLAMTVDDDGRGLDPSGSRAGAGLTNMRDRVDAVGGGLRLGTAPAGGLRVAVRIPVPRLAAV